MSARPDDVAAQFSRARSLQELGDLAGARAGYERVRDLVPGHLDAAINLSAVLSELGEIAPAVTLLRQALTDAPEHPLLHANLGAGLALLQQPEAAAVSLQRALALDPAQPQVHGNLGKLLRDAGDRGAAAAAYQEAARRAPEDPRWRCEWGHVLLADGRCDEALALATESLRAHPGHSGLLALTARALRWGGDEDSARALVDHEAFVVERTCAPPAGFASGRAFADALAAHILALPSLVHQPARHATRAGYHSGSLMVPPLGPVAHLVELIKSAVEEYGRRVPLDRAHPFLAQRPARVSFHLWAVVLDGSGHQIPHIHPDAWVSGVYYVQVPDSVATSGAAAFHAGPGLPGWLEFGDPGEPDFPRREETAPSERHALRPEPGRLVLFPSYFFHATIPHAGPGRRISVAFDAIPAT